MSNTHINIAPPTSSPTKLDAELVTVEGTPVIRERVEMSGSSPEEIARVTDTPPISSDHGLVARLLAESSNLPLFVAQGARGTKRVHHAVASTVASGGEATLDSPQVTLNTTAKLHMLVVSSSVPFKVMLRTVQNGIASTDLVVWFESDRGWEFVPPSPDFFQVIYDATPGLDAFRAVVRNMDVAQSADIYVTFMYTEE